MSILAKLFKKPAPLTLEDQLATIERLEQPELIETMQQSESDALRLAALKRVDDIGVLLRCSKGDHRQLSTAAQKRIGELLDAGTLALDSLRASVSEDTELLSLCAYSTKAAPQLVATLSDESTLATLACEGSTTQIRQAAAEKIASHSRLLDLQKQLKGKDKTVYRIIKDKLASFKAEQLQETEHIEVARNVCVQAETLSKRDVDDIFHARKRQIEASWTALDFAVPVTEQERYKKAMQLSQAKLTELADQAQAKEAAIAADKLAKKEVYDALGNLDSLVGELFTHATPGELAEMIEDAKQKTVQALNDAKQRGLTVASGQNQLSQLDKRAHAILDTLEGHGSFPSMLKEESPQARLSSLLKLAKTHLKEQPDWLKQAEVKFSERRAELKKANAEHKALLDKAYDLIRQGRTAVNHGQSGRVKAVDRKLDDILAKLGSVPAALQEKSDEFKSSMGKLGDWHEFAVTPKKEQLIIDMQALTESALRPTDLATKIKSLQDKWKTLAKGGINQDDDLWQQFQQASDTAYQPCKIYFDEEHQQRTQNLELREQLITQMQNYAQQYNWTEANWSEVEKTLKVARDAWQSYWPIPRKETERIQTVFDTTMDEIYGRLNDYYGQNKLKKAMLVQQAEKLGELTDTKNAIEKAKLLQGQWQQVGRCKRKDDQVLWQEFRKHCDGLFERRKQDYDAEKATREQQLQEAEVIIKQIRDIAELEHEAFFNQRSEIDDLSDRFHSLNDLPRAQAGKMREQFQKAIQQTEKKAATLVHQQENQMWQEIFEQMRIFPDDSNKSFTIPNKCPSKIREALEKRAAGHTIEGGEDALRRLCVDAELRHDIEVPESERALKMAMQVEQLQKNPGVRPIADTSSMKEQVALWVESADVQLATYDTLEQRFRKAWRLS